MLIQTLGESYQVICALKSAPGSRAYLCCREREPDGGRFIVQGIFDSGMRKEIAVFFLELSRDKNVPDFVQCFLKDGGMWSVFHCEEGTPFLEWAREKRPIEERFDAAAELMEQLFAAQLPVYLRYEALNPKNITVSQQSGVRIRFLLWEPQKIGTDVRMEVQKRISVCMEELLGEACRGASQQLTEFLERLRKAEFQSDGELFLAYRRLEETLRLAQAEGRLKEESIPLRRWKRLSVQWKNVLQFLYCLLIGALCGLFAYVCIVPRPVSGEPILFRSIGTLQIIPLPEPQGKIRDSEETEQPISGSEDKAPEGTEEPEETEEPWPETTEFPRELG